MKTAEPNAKAEFELPQNKYLFAQKGKTNYFIANTYKVFGNLIGVQINGVR